VATGEYGNAIELNAVQRSNPEMQKRAMNAIRALAEMDSNPIISIHDHGAGGHFNCLSELLEETGGNIHLDQLPIGDPTLSAKELLSNESQERMGLAIKEKDIDLLKQIAERERSPMYVIGEATGNNRLVFGNENENQKPVDFEVKHLLGSSPKTILTDTTHAADYQPVVIDEQLFETYLEQVLQLEAVACKDWLTNKVDRSVTGKVATQQTCGPLQLPLNNLGVMALDFISHRGVATALGHSPSVALIDPAAGSRMAIAESLTNIVFTPLTYGLKGVSLSANWMWPAKQPGENARLYKAVEAVSNFTIALGINIPTGKDSLSMTQKYPDGKTVLSPGTVIITAVAESEDIRKTVSPALQPVENSRLIWIDFSGTRQALGGSCLAQVLNKLGTETPDIADEDYFAKAFAFVQELIKNDLVLAGHDISAGGMITTLLEMSFSVPGTGMNLDISFAGNDWFTMLFAENPGVVLQVANDHVLALSREKGVSAKVLGAVVNSSNLKINTSTKSIQLDIALLRDTWYKTSSLLDAKQRPVAHAQARFNNYKEQPLHYQFPATFNGKLADYGIDVFRRKASGIKAAIIREKGVNGDREMAYALYLAGFDVKDVHMTDLVSGREDLSDVNMIVFVGGFSNSDVLGSAKGWAGAFRYNKAAQEALNNFYARPDTMSLGVCNGCQLMMELGLVFPELGDNHPRMHHNGSGKFESSFLTISIPNTSSIMLKTMTDARLGVWVAHGEGKFELPSKLRSFEPSAVYSYSTYPGNPNDSDLATAALCSDDGRHLAIMPHIERSLFPWNWAFYPQKRQTDEISPWIEAFVNARNWIAAQKP
jgi:phosphoribosylformylglycinamidine synthase